MTEQEDREAALRHLKALAWWMDSCIRIPGLGFRIGLESLLGMVPVVGDALGAALSGGIMLWSSRLGVSRVVLLRMSFNVALEALVGSIPLVGDLFDFAWKANNRNVALLADHMHDPRAAARAGWLFVGGVLAVLLVFLGALAWVGLLVLRWAAGLFAGLF